MSRPFENAFWIWDDGDPAPVNAYRIFRKILPPDPNRPNKLVARICASTRYKLYVNGALVSLGPAPSAKGVCAYDEIDVYGNHRHGGWIALAVVVNHIGAPNFDYPMGRAGMIFEMGDVVSDASWSIAIQSPWLSSSPRLTVQQGHAEYFDQRLEIGDWVGLQYVEWRHDEQKSPSTPERFQRTLARMEKAEQWTSATIVAPAYSDPWPVMEPSEIPSGSSSGFSWTFGQLINFGNCTSSDEESNVAKRMTTEQLFPLRSGTITLDQDEADSQDQATVTCADEDIYLLYDFGKEVSGIVVLTTSGGEGGTIDIGYDEALRVGDTPSSMKHGWVGLDELGYADQLIRNGGVGRFESFAPRAFRYIRLAVRGVTGEVVITHPRVEETIYPVEDCSSLTTSEPRLDNIWQIGKRTLHLCMDDHFMDCPSRERAQWVADARIQAIGARYCFGDSLLHRRFLRQTALSQYPDGRIDPVGPGGWDEVNPNMPIPGFVAIYVQSVLDYYMMTADGTLVEEVMPAVLKALGWLASHGAGEGGLLSDVPGWNFTDWAEGLGSWPEGGPSSEQGITAAVNLFYLQALRAAARLAEFTGDQAAAASNRTRATMIAGAFDSLFWNPLRGVYVDAVVNGEQSALASQQVNCLALLCDIGGTGRRASILDRLFSDQTLTQIDSPYFSFYLVEALAHVGRHQIALDYIRKHWGAMMDAGATTWWETWDGSASRCHAWSIAPNIWLPQQILGVKPHEAGFACVDIAPKPCDLKWVKGIVPIPQGDVVISWLVKDGKFTLDVTVPTGVHLRPILPCRPTDSLIIDGEPVDGDSIIRRSDTEVELAVLPGSGYRFEVVSAAA